MLAWVLLMSLSASAQTIERPTTKASAPKNGGEYVLVSAYNTQQYTFLTSWDGSVYLNKDVDLKFTAINNGDGTWSFARVAGKYAETEEDSLNYMNMVEGSGNLKFNSPTPVKWKLAEGDFAGFVRLQPDEGNPDVFKPLYLHLNAGGTYLVISEESYGGGWYPDYAGGTIAADNDYGFEVYDIGDGTMRAVMPDKTSENWAFVAIADFPEFKAKYQAYDALNGLVKHIETVDPDFEEGFNATLNAALAIYNSSDFNWEEDPEIIVSMINKKLEFEAAIEAAMAEETDELNTAIANAKSMFSTAVTVADVEAGIKAINDAVKAFKEGTGDITSYGTNMSFEDLAAQDGNTTSSVANPPIGWSVYINDTKVESANDVRSQGISAWFGVNGDCTGVGKDGQYAFGIWSSGIPKFEISQTIEGLENGTYVISAGLMVGANGNGSRRTTQRIFGNLNSTYFASADEYNDDLLDKSEVHGYADLVEPVTDTELQPISVRAYVYDGKLTFGLRTDGNFRAALRESSNGAGGDGWFKLDNFHIQKEGYIGEDAAAVANYFINIFDIYSAELIEEALRTEIDNVLKGYDKVTATTPAEDINNIITVLTSKMGEVEASIDAYNKLRVAIDEGYEHANEYMYYSGIDAYTDLLLEADNVYADGSADTAGVLKIIEQLAEALIELQKSGIAVGDYMNIIQNPSFEDLSAQNGNPSDGVEKAPTGWNLYINGEKVERASFGGWCAINRGDQINETDQNGTEWTTQYTDGEFLWGVWTANVPEIELSQTFTGIPSGTYTLSCDLVVQYNWGGHCVTTQRIFANNYVQMYGAEETYADHLNETSDMLSARLADEAHPEDEIKHMNYAGWLNDVSYGYTSCPHHMELTFGVDEPGDLTIGFRTNNVDPFTGEAHMYDSAGWFKLDNFKLFYNSEDVPVGISGINSKANELVGRQYFTIDGRRISQPQSGITIVKNIMSDGTVKTTKILK